MEFSKSSIVISYKMSYVTFSFDFINAIKLSLAVFFDYFNEKIILNVSGDTYI